MGTSGSSEGESSSMKSMKLYDHVDRIKRDLASKGVGHEDALTVAMLTPFDQYHYHGTSAIDEAVRLTSLPTGARVLDVGSGIGGPARYLAHSTDAQVTALELQADLHELATQLTTRCGLEKRIKHLCGNILDGVPAGGPFDAVVSWLVFLHIPDRERLFSLCRSALKPDGVLYIEDFVIRTELNATDRALLEEKLRCHYLPDQATYIRQVSAAGFSNIVAEDMSNSWREFTAGRLEAYRVALSHKVQIYGEEVANGLLDFYVTVADLFARGVVGGIRLHARA